MRIARVIFIFSGLIISQLLTAQNLIMSNGTVNTCSGTFVDPGSLGQYPNNANYTYTICSNVAGQCVSINFSQFILENGFDFLRIYNGPNTASPLIATLTGNGVPIPSSYTATSGCLTFWFTSDITVNYAGWVASVTCVPCPQPMNCGCPSGGNPPANDLCNNAQNIGVLGTPANCPNGQGAHTTLTGTNNCATAPNPYLYQLGCQPAGNQAAPAADVWYQVTLTGTELHINITSGMTQPNVALFSGLNCNNLTPRGCAVGSAGSLTSTFAPLAPGNYWIQISGGNLNDQCDFSIEIWNNVDCAGCILASNLTANPPPVNGTYPPGTNVQFCLTISDYNQTSQNWLHGICPTFGPGWDMATLTTTPPASCDGYGYWAWYNGTVTSSATGAVTGPGFFYESTLGDPNILPNCCLDGDPGNNYGDNNPLNLCDWTFCWNITTVPPNQCVNGMDLSIDVLNYGDGESGSWTSFACSGDPPNVFNAILQCCFNPTVSVVNTSCSGANGSATTTGQGTGPWTYQWYDGNNQLIQTNSNVNGTATINGLAFGNYYVIVTDGTGCTSTANFFIDQSNSLTVAIAPTNVSCNGASNGSINITPGGTPPFTYSWSNGSTNEDLSGLAPGTYTVTVTGAGGCTGTASATITQPLALASSQTHVNVLCSSAATGSIDLSATGGIGAYSYSWSNGATTQDLVGLLAGTYNVTVTDVNGCTSVLSVSVTQPTVLNLSSTTVNATCGSTNGSINLTVTGGTAGYSYTWSNGSTIQDPLNLGAGTYTITVTDANGCTSVSSVSITTATGPTVSETHINGTCGNSNGSIDLTVNGGSAPFSYSWSSGGGTQDLTGLNSGSYTATVTDANGCSAVITVAISNSTPPVISETHFNAVCGNSNGSIDITPVGSAPFSYSWSNGATTQDVSSLNAGSFTVTVTDVNNCTSVLSVSISNTSVPVISETHFNSSCGNSNGSIDVTISSGTAPFAYSWSNGATSQDLSGLTSGSYSVTVTDINGCTAISSISITDSPPVTLSAITTNQTCGLLNGAIDLFVNSGTTPYSYSWSNGTTSQDLANISSGSYTVTVTDPLGCSSTSTFLLTNSTAPLLSETHVNSACGNSNGSIDLSVSGGTAPFVYSWSNGSTDQDILNLSAGSFSVTVTDAFGCTTTLIAPITDSPSPTLSETHVDATCGLNNGSVDLIVNGGTLPFTYAWSNSATTQDISGIGAATYSVSVTDINGCTVVLTVALNNSPVQTLNEIHLDAICGGLNGSIDLSVNGGTAPLTFIWSNGATTEDISGLAAGSFTVTVTDANNCTAILNVGISNTVPPVLSETHANATCSNSNGSIDLTVNGSGPFTFSWSNGNIVNEDLSGLGSGTYTVTVTDVNGCTSVLVVPISNSTLPALFEIHTDAICGLSNGLVDLTATGNSPFTYLWSNGSTTEDISGLATGFYSVTVTDAFGCTSTLGLPIGFSTNPLPAEIHADATCGASNGSINLSVSNGTGPFVFTWSNGATTEDINSISAGTYSVTVTDNLGCTAILSIPVSNIAGPSLSEAHIHETCSASNGSIDISVNGGTVPFSFLWSSGSTTEDLLNVAAGNYSVTVTDANNCTAAIAVAIANSTSPSLSSLSADATCGNSNGSIDLSVSGGTIPFVYSWSNGSTSEDIAMVAAGNYSVTVTDANGCSAIINATISNIPGPTLSEIHSNTTCSGNNGSIDLSVSGGTAPFNYLWSNASTSEDITGIAAGSFTVTVTDANGCTAIQNIAISDILGQTLSEIHVNTTCNQSNGSIDISVNDGTLPFTYNWSNGATTQDLFGIAAGSFMVTVTDANNCTAVLPVSITNTSGPALSEVHINETCTSANASIDLTVNGGIAPFAFSWSNGSSSEDLANISAGSYSVTVTDANNCTATLTVNITDSPPPVLAEVHVDATCGNNNGAVDLTVSNGTVPFTFSWSNGDTSEDINNIPAGTYDVTVTDINGCTATLIAGISNALAPTLSSINVSTTCGSADGSIDLTVGGGAAPLTFQWSNGFSTEDISNILSGNYTVTVTDANNCVATLIVNVADIPGPILSSSATNTTCGNSNGAIDLTVNGGTGPFAYDWNGGTYATEDLSNITSGSYNVSVTDINGCTAGLTVSITNTAGPTLLVFSADENCGQANGTLDITVNGGTPPFSYSWSNGSTAQDLAAVAAGNYSATVTDGNGCTAVISSTINNIPGPTLSSSQTDATCGQLNGMVDLTVSGGVAPFSFNWNGGVYTSEDITNVGAGSYDIVVTDADGCTATLNASISNIGSPTLNLASLDATCGNPNAGIDLSVIGGTGPFTFDWNNGSYFSEDLANIPAGNYSVNVTDANGCIASANIAVNNIAGPNLSSTQVDATCGNSNALVDLNVNGGTAPFIYNWNSGAFLTEDLSGIPQGNYSVVVTDANGCIANLSVSINNISGPALGVTTVDENCGQANGLVDLNVNGGTAPFSYFWSNATTSQDLSATGAGTYDVTVTDANGCTAILSASIINIPGPALSSLQTDATCGQLNGAVDLNVSGGSAPYNFNWNSGVYTSEDLTNVGAGSYDVIVTDADGCTANLAAAVSNIGSPTLSLSSTDATCGNANASVDLTVSSGSAPYTFSWNGGIFTTEDLANVSPGIYSVNVADDNGCIASAAVVINNIAGPVLSSTSADAACGNSDGSVDLTVIGGTSPYVFDWNSGTFSTEDLVNVPAGLYDVIVMDSNGCTTTLNVSVNNIAGPSLTGSAIDENCGQTNGSIDASVFAGTAPYNYIWSNGNTNQDLTGISFGNYSLTVTDANGCTATLSSSVSNISGPTLSASNADATCSQANGSIDLTVTGGSGPFAYDWNSGAYSTEDIAGITSGNYSVIMTDADGCTAALSATILNLGSPQLSITTQDAACGNPSGWIDMSVSGGTAPFSFSWNGGLFVTEDLSSIPSGNYDVVVTDANGCTAIAAAIIGDVSGPLIFASVNFTTCEQDNGSIDLLVIGGTAPFSYDWNSGTWITEDLSGLPIGNFTVIVSDANGCSTTATYAIANYASPGLAIFAMDELCNQQNGSVNLSVIGGTAPFSFLWSNSTATEDLSGIASGNYTVTVTDFFGCTATISAAINNISGPALSVTTSDATCGQANGAADLSVSGGIGPYSFDWVSGTYSSEDISNLPAGNFDVVVTDGNGCTASLIASISNVGGAILGISGTESTCGNSNGAIDLTVSGGTAPFIFDWNSGTFNTEDLMNVAAGSYAVVVTDANGCFATTSIIISNVAGPNLSSITSNSTCSQLNGIVDLAVGGGTAPFSFDWNSGTFFTEDVFNVASGNYTVIVTDANGCTATLTATINNTGGPTLTANLTPDACGQSVGAINLFVNNGTAPFSYLWSSGQTTQDISGILTGSYSVTVTDGNGCTVTNSSFIFDLPAPSAGATWSDATCGQLNGAIDLSVSGIFPPFTFDWNSGAFTTEDLSNVAAGNYNVVISDINGCIASVAVSVGNIGGAVLSAISTDETCSSGNASIDLSVAGGTAPYIFDWNSGVYNTEDLTGISSGTYNVIVTDVNGCLAALVISISNTPGAVLAVISSDATCGLNNGAIDLTVIGGTAPYSFNWNSGSFSSEDLAAIPPGNYSVVVTDANGCTAIVNQSISDIPGPLLSISFTDENCSQSNGTIDLIVSSGTLPYSYQWSNSAVVEDLTGVASGNYTVTVTDANGCSQIVSTAINNIPGPALSAIATDATCGQTNGFVDLNVTGGAGPFSYDWNGGSFATQDISNAGAGNYSVIVSDVNGCTASLSASISNIGGPSLSILSLDETCTAANASIDLTVSNGTGPFNFDWNSGTYSSEDLANISSGNYSVVVTDVNGCIASANMIILDSPAPSLIISTIYETCTAANASIDLTVNGGSAPISFDWNSGAYSTEDLSNISAGSYDVVVTDANGCTVILNTVISNTPGPSLGVSSNDATCGVLNGAVDLSVIGGTGPFGFDWNSGAFNTEDLNNIAAGNYSVIVTDANGCSTALNTSISNIGGPALSVSSIDETCGNSNGSVDLSVTSGTAPFAFDWNNGSFTTEDISNLPSGNYSVNVTDANGCIGTLNVTVINIPGPILNSIPQDAACGNANGAIDLIVNGGSAPFGFNWNSGSFTEDLINILVGSYNVTVTDANGCTTTLTTSINDIPGPSLSISALDENCGQSNGSIDLNVNGGTFPFNYSWSTGSNSQDLIGIGSGSYSVTITDVNGCMATISVAINDIQGPSLSFSSYNDLCGNSSGAIDLNVNGGTGPFVYNWNNGAFLAEDLVNIAGGAYNVTVTDANGCTAITTVNINSNAPPYANSVICNGNCGVPNGWIDLIVGGGTAPYLYDWNFGSYNTEDIFNLPAGNYYAIVTDANGCTTDLIVTVNNSPVPALSVTYTDETCSDSNGSINLNVSSGSMPFTYDWNGGAFLTEDLNNIPIGIYSVTVTDAAGCTATLSQAISNTDGPLLSDNHLDATCGSSNGSVDLNVAGGTGPFTYNWSNGTITEDLSNIAAGNYDVTVTDANGCTATLTSSISNIGGPMLSLFFIDETCSAFNAAVDLTVTSGTGPFNFDWNSGTYGTEDLSNISSGNYSVVVTDANGCIASTSVNINDSPSPILSLSSVDETCTSSNASLNLSVNGGAVPFSFDWNSGLYSTEDLNNISSGNYSVLVTDANGCTAAISASLTNTPGPILNALSNDETCTASNGSINLNVNGGTGPFVYDWNSGAFITQDLLNIAAGGYNVIVTDANGCTASLSASIVNTAGPLLSFSSVDETCSASNGIIDLNVNGGTGPFIFDWNGGNFNTEDLINISAGNYSVIVTDANGCTATISQTIQNSAEPQLSLSSIDETCTAANGNIDLSVTSGTAPFSFDWNSGTFTTEDLTSISSGNYSVIVTDMNGCTATISVLLANTPGPLLNAVPNDETCTASNGFIDLSVMGGTGPFSYDWNSGTYITQDLLNLPSGNYDVVVSDANGCTASLSASLNNIGGPSLSLSSVDETCTSGNGAIDLSISNGTGPFSFDWNSGAFSTEDLNNISAGNYSVTVTDANGCTATTTLAIINSGSPQLSLSSVDETCTLSNGSVNLSVNGGMAPFSFDWNGGTYSTEDLSNISSGSYNVIVSDVNGCTAASSVSISDSPAPALSASWNDATCGVLNGSVDLSVSSGLGPFTYDWNNGTYITEDLLNIAAGNYDVIVTDINGCTATLVASINNIGGPTLSLASVDETCTAANASIDLTVSSGTGPFSFDWNSGVFITEDLAGIGAGNYSVVVTDNNGCIAAANLNISDTPAPSLAVNIVDETCTAGNASIDLNISGGTAPISFDWNSGTYLTEDIINISAGIYNVIVTDVNGCTAATAAVIVNSPGPLLSVTTIDETCTASNGSINLNLNGGSGPFVYDWNGGAFVTEDLLNVGAGNYDVVVTDGNGCTSTLSSNINNLAGPTISLSSVNETCTNSNGSIDLNVNGGTGPFNFDWNGGTFSTEDLINISAGNYSVIVTDANGCVATINQTITNNAAPQLSLSSIDETCTASNGSIDLNVNGGTGPFIYDWNSGAFITEDLTGINAGNYSVLVTDANGCTASFAASIVNSPGPNVNANSIDATCGSANGSVNLQVQNGTAPYSYDWNSGAYVTQDLSGVISGNYNVVVTDANGCTATLLEIVNNIPGPGLIVSAIDATCGSANGGIDLSVNGGTGPFSFDWNGGAFSSEDLSNITMGNYNVIVTDDNGCTASISSVVNNIGGPTLSSAITNETCGYGNGTIDLNVIGGTGPYNYSWNGGAFSTQDLFGIFAGNYNVTVTDANGCVVTLSTAISNTTGPSLSIASVNAICSNDNGALDLTVNGGTAPYSFDWNSGLFLTEDVNNIPSGNYTIVVTDANGCTASMNTNLNFVPGPILSWSQTSSTCGSANGTIDLDVQSGTAPYTYNWNSGAYTTQDLVNIFSGNYSVIVTDMNGCSETITANVANIAGPLLTVAVSDASCGNNNGSADLTVTGGTGPFVYDWNSGAYSSEDISGVGAGSYDVVVTDANGCTATIGSVIGNIAGPLVSVSSVDETCGYSNGFIDLSVNGGTQPLSYDWNGGTYNSQDLTNVASGNYAVIVTDANGCTASLSANVTNIPGPSVSYTSIDATCGYANGTVDLLVSGGSAPFSFSWNNGSFLTEDLVNILSGNYTVIVTDMNGCTTSTSVALNNIAGPGLAVSLSNETCGDSNGTIDLTVNGGTAPFSYSWNSGLYTSQDITNLAAGNYSVIVTDNNGCTTMLGVGISNSPAPALSSSQINTTCSFANGSIDLLLSGGTGPFIYDWNSGVYSSEDLTGVLQGNYSVIVTDANGCTATLSASLTDSPAPTLGVLAQDATCGAANGSLMLSVTAGAAPFTYNWNSGSYFTQNLFGLINGSYSVIVSDANGCTATISATVDMLLPPPVNILGVLPDYCITNDPITIAASPLGGIFTGTGMSGNIFDPLAAGVGGPYLIIYSFADSNGCISIDTVSTSVNDIPHIDIAAQPLEGCEPLTVVFTNNTTNGGIYSWEFGDGNSDNSASPTHVYDAGIYNVILIASNPAGCSDTADWIYVNSVQRPIAAFNVTPSISTPYFLSDASFGFTNLSLYANSYAWDFGDGTTSTLEHPSHTYTAIDSYYVLLIADNDYGCPDTAREGPIIILPEGNFFVPNAFTPNGDGSNDWFQVYGSGIVQVHMTVFDRWGEPVFESTEPMPRWDGTLHGKPMNAAVFVYLVEVSFIDGFTLFKKGDLTLIR